MKHEQYSERDKEMIAALSEGKSRKEIADEHGLSVRSVESIFDEMRFKGDAKNAVHLVAKAIRTGLVPFLAILVLASCSKELSEESTCSETFYHQVNNNRALPIFTQSVGPGTMKPDWDTTYVKGNFVIHDFRRTTCE